MSIIGSESLLLGAYFFSVIILTSEYVCLLNLKHKNMWVILTIQYSFGKIIKKRRGCDYGVRKIWWCDCRIFGNKA